VFNARIEEIEKVSFVGRKFAKFGANSSARPHSV